MSSLADVLPSRAYSLSYVLPILFVSLILVFAGSFLTLQRSQSFAPRNDAMQLPGAFGELDKKKPIFYLEGGIGGICAGYAFGLHASTFFALLVSHKTSSHSLSANAFVAVWMLSCIPLAILGGRFKYAALLFAGITGGALTALTLCIAIHPSLLTRQIILGIFAVLLSLFVAIPLPFSQEPATRLAMCATGAFGIAYSAAILGSVSAWSDVWARLWISNDITWGTSAERGLSAAFWLLFTLGWVSDWSLKRYFGGNPDQKWDAYLAEYTTSLPQCDERAGTFVPDTSTIWDRVSHPFARRSRVSSTHVYDATILGPSPPFTEKPLCEYDKPRLLQKSSDRPIARLRALARESSGRKREAVKFKPLSSAQEHDLSSDDEGIALPLVPPLLRRQDTNRTQTSVSNTLTNGSDIEFDYEKERARLFGVKKEVLPSDSEGDAAPEYSDYEEDVTASVSKKRDVPAGAPLFISHGQDSIADYSAHTPITSESIPPGAVPLTPSLINAIDRIAVAQSEAFGARQRDGLPLSTTGDSVLLTPTVNGPSNGEHWDAFWRDVTTKASQGARR